MSVYLHRVFILLILSSVVGIGAAQEFSPRFQHLTIDDGLSQSAVYALMQDRQGFIWIGTKDGLNRYDGYEFTIYQHNPFDSTTISNNYITAILEDSRGYLWVGTREGGLNRLNRASGKFRRYAHDPQNRNSLSNNRITTLAEDSSGALWVGTVDGLNRLGRNDVERLEPMFQRFHQFPEDSESLSSDAVESLLVDSSGHLWVGTANGLNHLNAVKHDTTAVFRRYFSNPAAPGHLMDDHIYSLYESRDGVLWVGTISGLNRFQRESDTFTVFPHHFRTYRRGWGKVGDVEEDEAGRLWLATPDELMIFDPARKSYRSIRRQPAKPTSLSSNGLTHIIRDRSGVFWIGTNGYGLNLYDPKADRFFTYRRPRDFASRISRFSITSLMEDRDGNLWVGADVLYRWNRKTDDLQSFETDSDHPRDFGNTGVWSMLQDSSGAIWVTGYEGLYRYDPVNRGYRHFGVEKDLSKGIPEKVTYHVFLDRDGYLWVGTAHFFSRYDDGIDRFTHYRYRRRPKTREVGLTDVWEDGQGIFWLATDDGLARFDAVSGTFDYFRSDPNDPHSLGNNVVLCIQPDPQNDAILWLGTAGGGLNRFDTAQRHFRHFTEIDGLPNNVVYAVLPDESGNLWLSTNKGLSRFTPATGAFRNFDVSDGLQSNEFNTGAYFKSRSGEMFFGGIKGLTFFYPQKITDNPHIPNVVITGLKIFNREIGPETDPDILSRVIGQARDITLSYRQNVITFEFAALDFSASSRNQYAYRIMGLNDDWIPSGTVRSATYTNLPPGDYVFQVKGSNNDGIWNEQGARLAIHIDPPPWLTWWAYILYAVAILGALYGVRRYELNRLRLKGHLKVEQAQSEKLRELDQFKSRFFANISHEFRTPLTLILGQIDRVLRAEHDRERKNRLEVAQRNAFRLLRLINQVLDLSKLEAGSMSLKATQGNIVPFLKNLVFAFESLAEQKQITLTFHCARESIGVRYEADKLEKVFSNLFSNALKFTSKGGEVRVECKLQSATHPAARVVQIRISDTGTGIPADQLPHIFNRFYQVDGSHTREQEGTGIGLALAKELVELHRGEIHVSSEIGKGTTFAVLLPVDETSPARAGLQPGGLEKRAPKAEASLRNFLPETTDPSRKPVPAVPLLPESQTPIVLVVEDHPDVRAYICDRLAACYLVLEACNGEDGLQTARQQVPDLIITDIMMPKMDGYQLCTILKNDELTCHIPIIMLTAKAGLEDKIEGLQTGVDDYLLKPFSAKELLVRVANLIDLRRRLRERFRLQTVVKPAEVTAVPMDRIFLQKVLEAIEEGMGDERFDVETLAKTVNMSVSQLNRKLRALVDQAAGHLLRSMRLQRAADLLKQNAGNVAEVCYRVGFCDQANFTRAFKKRFGTAPGAYRKKNGIR